MQWSPLYPHSLVLPLYVLKRRDEPLKEHPRGRELELTLYAVVSLRPSACAASHAPQRREWEGYWGEGERRGRRR